MAQKYQLVKVFNVMDFPERSREIIRNGMQRHQYHSFQVGGGFLSALHDWFLENGAEDGEMVIVWVE